MTKYDIMPIFLMDLQDSIYMTHINGVSMKGMANHYKKEWKKAYTKLNSRFFRVIKDEDRKLEIADMMADFEDAVTDSINKMRNTLPILPSPVSTESYLCFLLACVSYRIAAEYSTFYPDYVRDIKAVAYNSSNLSLVTAPKDAVFETDELMEEAKVLGETILSYIKN